MAIKQLLLKLFKGDPVSYTLILIAAFVKTFFPLKIGLEESEILSSLAYKFLIYYAVILLSNVLSVTFQDAHIVACSVAGTRFAARKLKA